MGLGDEVWSGRAVFICFLKMLCLDRCLFVLLFFPKLALDLFNMLGTTCLLCGEEQLCEFRWLVGFFLGFLRIWVVLL